MNGGELQQCGRGDKVFALLGRYFIEAFLPEKNILSDAMAR